MPILIHGCWGAYLILVKLLFFVVLQKLEKCHGIFTAVVSNLSENEAHDALNQMVSTDRMLTFSVINYVLFFINY